MRSFLRCLVPLILLLTFLPLWLPAPAGAGVPLRPAAPGDIVISEVAWGGTAASTSDEWIELYNTTAGAIDLTGWTLQAQDGTPAIPLVGTIPAYGYFLLERSDDNTISDIPADQIYTGALDNTGEVLELRDAGGVPVDTANGDGGPWPAGSGSPDYLSMERIDPWGGDSDANWAGNDTLVRNGRDANGAPINGTPKLRNSASAPAADLVVAKAAPAGVAAGAPITYTIRLENRGNLAATATQITDTLPSAVSFVAQAGPYPFTYIPPRTLLWEAGTVPFTLTPALITISGTVALTASGTLVNQVVASTSAPEVTMVNNTAQAATVVWEALPDLAVSKAGPPTATPGMVVTYTLVVENSGPLDAPAVLLSDTLPAGLTFLTQTSPYTFSMPAPDLLRWELGDLPDGAMASLLVLGEVLSSAQGLLTNTAWASTSYTETTLANNTARWTITLALPGSGDVVINEVGWAGTAASTSDEWIELYNASPYDVDLTGWTLDDGGDISITLSGVIPAQGYFLLERSDDSTISDIPADQIYVGGLSNTGETLVLRNAGGAPVDTANGDGGLWPAGTASPTFRSMERVDPALPDDDSNWTSNDMVHRNGRDANGAPINGTPQALNSAAYPPPPTPDVAVSKAGPLTTTPGMVITYTLAVGNIGQLPAPAVVLSDILPAGVAFLSQTSPYTFSQPAPDLLRWEVGTLPSATWGLLTVSVRVEAAAVGTLTNLLSATTTVSETDMANNTARWDTLVIVTGTSQVLIEALLYDGYQTNDPDEAALLVNIGGGAADLTGWRLCDAPGGGSCAALPAVPLGPGERIWVTGDAAAFATSFGVSPTFDLASWPGYSNSGDEAVLRDDTDAVVDTLVYEGGDTNASGWSGPAVEPYAGSGNFGSEGQILRRILDEATGRPAGDTNTRADWMQYPGDSDNARRLSYPGWDLEAFFWPLSFTQHVSMTVAIAPDNAAEVFLRAINRATTSIEAVFYDLKHYGIVQALAEKAAQGVSVRVLLEGEPAGGVADQELWACQEIEAAGGECWFMFNEPAVRIYDRYANMHSKIVLVDRTWAVVSSQNPTGGGLPDDDKSDGTWGSRGVLLLTDAPPLVDRLAAILEADLDPAHHNDLTRWAPDNPYGYSTPPPGFVPITSSGGITSPVDFPDPLVTSGTMGIELFSAPEAALRQSDALLGLLARAGPGDWVDVEQMYEYRSWGVMEDSTPAPNLRLEAYIEAARRGAHVRILLNLGSFDQDFFDISKNLETVAYVNGIAHREGLNLQARLGDPTNYGIHNKLVLVRLGNQGYAHIGSINGSETSSKINREVAVQVRSNAVYDYLEEMFERDWNRSGWLYLPLVMKRQVGPADHLLVSEVLYDPEGTDAGREWVELYNPTNETVDLTGWTLGDAVVLGEYGSGRYAFPAGATIPPFGLLTVAAQAEDVSGFVPNYEFLLDPYRDDPTVPNMVPVDTWDGFGFALGNAGDEVMLMDASEQAVDVLVYGTGDYPGVTPHPGGVTAGHSLERRPPERDTDDCSVDLSARYPPTPGELP